MSKINISFNNTDYVIDKLVLAATKNELQSHFSSTINGSGAIITFDGTSYGLDSADLTSTKSEFINDLADCLSDTGYKFKLGELEYFVDPDEADKTILALQSDFYALADWNNTALYSLLDEGLLDEFILE